MPLSQSPATFYEALDELLTYAAQVLDTIPTFPETADLAGAPAARFITAGLPAIDCCPAMYAYGPSVVEATTSPANASLDPAQRSGAFPRVNLPTLNLTVVRCTPAFQNDQASPPTDAQQAAVARQVYADGWALWVELSRAVRQNLLFIRCKGAFMDSWTSLDTSGGCAGATFSMRVPLNGFTSVLPGA
jgi:hypothetical protein